MTVTPAADPCVGNLATPVNSGYFIKGLINNLPLYRPGISPNFRGLETGAAFGYLLYGPFTICSHGRAATGRRCLVASCLLNGRKDLVSICWELGGFKDCFARIDYRLIRTCSLVDVALNRPVILHQALYDP